MARFIELIRFYQFGPAGDGAVANLEEEKMIIPPKCKPSIVYQPFVKRVAFLIAILLFGVCPINASAFEILLGTDESGTLSHFTGRTICRLINQHADGIECRIKSSSGYVDNLTNLQDGSLDMALTGSRILYDAVNKSDYFAFLDIDYSILRTLLPLYEIPLTLVVRSDAKIDKLADLKGKRVNAGAPRSLQQLALAKIMEAKSWSRQDFSLVVELPASQSQDTMAFCYGRVQAMVHIGVHPDPALQQVFKLCQAKLVGLQDDAIAALVEDHPAYWPVEIAADTYQAQPEKVATYGVRMVLAASSDLDDETVSKILDALYRNRQRLQSAHPALAALAPQDVSQAETGIQLHPAAEQFFAEKR